MRGTPPYEVVVVGGGPAGLTTAIYTTRLGHRTAVVDAGDGRHEAVARIHNLIGVSPDTAGADLSATAVDQLTTYGAEYYDDTVSGVERDDAELLRFDVRAEQAELTAERVVLATGFTDKPPDVPGLIEFTGHGLYYCLHCDAYALGDEPAFVLGHDDHAAAVAMVLLNVTADVDLLLDGADPDFSDPVAAQLAAHPVDVIDRPVDGPVPPAPTEDDGRLRGLAFEDGTSKEYRGGFAMYGREYNHELAVDLGCELHDDGAVAVDGDRRTSVEGVYAVGDLTHGQNQTPIALGDGAYAGIALHKDLRTFPVAADEVDDVPEPPAMADDLRARMRRVNDRGMHVGLAPSQDSGCSQ